MIHIATIHWKTNFFKEVQYRFIKRNISSFKIWAFSDKLPKEEIDHKKDSEMYYFCEDGGEPDHRKKLDRLAKKILNEAKEDDVILFLDGDSWPVAPIDNLIRDTLEQFPMGAVIRIENGERHTHPCFTFTKVKFWSENNLSWKEGYIRDRKYGVNFIKHFLSDRKLNWKKFYRTKGITDHKVFFSIYGDVVYHHGAGFRDPVSGYCVKNKISISREENLSIMKKFIEIYGD